MKVFLLASFLLLGAHGASIKLREHDQRFILMPDDRGHVRVVDLHHVPSEPKANVSDITFYLYTVDNRAVEDGEMIPAGDFEALVNSQLYNPARKNAFLLHGWIGDYQSSYIISITAALLDHFDMNVFAIDWSGPAGLFYTEAVQEIPSCGAIIGDFAKQMINQYGLTEDDFILIGHSLGGQLIGRIGAELGGQVDTIIALDPAGPVFSLEDTELSLDPSDGKFIQVIHTNDGILGFPLPCGHADYFPNGGEKQPGCGTDPVGTCAHTRSHEYFVESIYSAGFRSVQCTSYEDFLAGACEGNPESNLGQYPVDKTASGSYFLQTAEEPPFSLE